MDVFSVGIKTEQAESKYNLDYCSWHSALSMNILRISNEVIDMSHLFCWKNKENIPLLISIDFWCHVNDVAPTPV